jgi:uncharacterized protein YdgA (DUF945 family)
MIKRNNLILFGLLIVLLAILLLTPRLIGTRIEASVDDTVSSLMTDNLRSQLQWQLLDYQRNWFKSSARYKIDYLPAGTDSELSMELDLDIAHGPLHASGDNWHLGLAGVTVTPALDSKEIRKALMELPFPAPTPEILLLVGFDESLEFRLNIAPGQFDNDEGSFRFAGLQGQLIAEADLSARGSLDMGELTATSANSNESFSLQGLQFSTETAQINDLFAPSMAMIAIPAISARGINDFSAEGIRFSSTLDQTPDDAERLNISQDIAIDSISAELPLSSLSWQFELNRLPLDLLRNYSDLVNESQLQMSGNAGDSSQLAELGQQLGMQLLAADFAINSQLRADAWGASHQAALGIDYAGVADVQDFSSMNPRSLLNAIELSLQVDLDLEAALRSPLAGMIDPYVQQGYIHIDNGRIRLDAELADSQLLLNGETIALDQWFAP